ncbi:MAG: 50S ribosomal protein L23 [Thermoleophilia bacterium]
MDARQVILRPVISEKSYEQIEHNKYTFEVHPKATKGHIRDAVEEIFGVNVIGVNTVNMKPKPKRRGLHRGHTRRWKKAVVELAPGDRIEFFGAA